MADKRQYHPFMPPPMHKPRIIRWLKHFHAWFGVWGAFAGLIFAWSGFVLNHRTDFRIGGDNVTTEMTIPAPAEQSFASGDDFAAYVKSELDLYATPRPPAMGGGMGAAVPGEPFDGIPERFAANFTSASEQFAARYESGNDVVEIAHQHRPFIRTLNRMHLGQAPDRGWQIIMDVFSGALIFLCLSGFLIWSRLDGGRLLGGSLAGVSAGLVLFWIFAGA